MRCKVTSYAGYRGDEEPRSFGFAHEEHVVVEVIKRWRDPEADFFEVRADDDRAYRLRHDRELDAWTVSSMKPRTQ